ncbi:MAG: hypothetical protein IJO21_02490 [Oscillospiraceae bacterium]|nr:hypothetical protein [Oscillospiraceae bacterium]
MIAKLFFDGVIFVGRFFLGLLPDIGFTVPSGVWGAAADFVNMIGYLLPVGTINAIIALMVDIIIFRIGVAFIRFILDVLPF